MRRCFQPTDVSYSPLHSNYFHSSGPDPLKNVTNEAIDSVPLIRPIIVHHGNALDLIGIHETSSHLDLWNPLQSVKIHRLFIVFRHSPLNGEY